ncbi:MAG TPA: lysine--tRNA ligase [Candidatus Binatia bacterium]|nr:lysine--tRNA ligase [Candidatus Binatia bacterium]
MSDDDLTATRRAKLAEWRAAGRPYPNDFRQTDHARDLHARFGSSDAAALEALAQVARVAGRIVGKRSFGQAMFVVVEDASGRLQTYLRRDALPADAWAVARTLDLGDVVGVAGTVFRTKTNELTIAASEVALLAKCLHVPPEKWHGLADVEIRYRRRYLDLIANPSVRDVFRKRAQIVAGIRRFLDERGFLEVETPILQQIAGGAAARPFRTHHNTLDLDLQLRIAPELFLKRLLVGGFERVYEIGRNFRNEGISTQHNPEFTMLEFYQAYATFEDLIPLTEELVSGLADEVCGARVVPYGEHRIDLTPPWRRISLVPEAARAAGASQDELRDPIAARRVAERRGVAVPPGVGAGWIATALFEQLVEPTLVQPTFVTGFPTEVSPLARGNDRDPFLVDRFELYVAAREAANGFSELNDPDDQRARFLAQLESRARGDEEAHPMDEDYVSALEYAMPPAAGEGIGIDRLTMLLCDAPSIRDVVLFPLLRPERRPGGDAPPEEDPAGRAR